VILLGALGAGKSTFARAMLDAFGTRREAEGSPTFAIAHEYVSTDGIRIVHADGYRLKSEAELEATGLLETLWDPEAVVLFEWMDLFPETADALARSELPCLTVRLAIVRGDGGTERRIEFERTGF